MEGGGGTTGEATTRIGPTPTPTPFLTPVDIIFLGFIVAKQKQDAEFGDNDDDNVEGVLNKIAHNTPPSSPSLPNIPPPTDFVVPVPTPLAEVKHGTNK